MIDNRLRHPLFDHHEVGTYYVHFHGEVLCKKKKQKCRTSHRLLSFLIRFLTQNFLLVYIAVFGQYSNDSCAVSTRTIRAAARTHSSNQRGRRDVASRASPAAGDPRPPPAPHDPWGAFDPRDQHHASASTSRTARRRLSKVTEIKRCCFRFLAIALFFVFCQATT